MVVVEYDGVVFDFGDVVELEFVVFFFIIVFV